MAKDKLNATEIKELSNELRKKIDSVRAQINSKANVQSRSIPTSTLLPIGMQYGSTEKTNSIAEKFPYFKMEYTYNKAPQKNSNLGLLPRAEFATVKINQRATTQNKEVQKREIKPDQSLLEFSNPKKNKYFDPNLQSLSSRAPKARAKRALKFIKKDTFVNEAREMYAKMEMERLKREIEKSVKKTGMSVELELVSDKVVRVDPPPSVEWWDKSLAPYGYDNAIKENIAQTSDLMTNLVQHPVSFRAPHEAKVAPTPVILTRKERKKFRRQRSLERQKEKTDKIMLGLLPQEQPKAKIKNMMLIYKNEAVRDPTKVEAMVRAQIMARKQKHKNLVESTKLTPEQRRIKKKRKLEEDKKSNVLQVVVFRIDDLSSMKHRFKIDKNAVQMNLTGVAVIHHKLNVVVVEGGPKAIKFYKKLMLRRIKWSDTEIDNRNEDENASSMSEDQDRTVNKAVLVWEGRVKERLFCFFKVKVIPTESMCRDFFEKMHCIHYWDAARNYLTDELDITNNNDSPDANP